MEFVTTMAVTHTKIKMTDSDFRAWDSLLVHFGVHKVKYLIIVLHFNITMRKTLCSIRTCSWTFTMFNQMWSWWIWSASQTETLTIWTKILIQIILSLTVDSLIDMRENIFRCCKQKNAQCDIYYHICWSSFVIFLDFKKVLDSI